MELTELTFRLLFIFLPGIITAVIIDRLTKNDKIYNIGFFISTVFFGLLTYIILNIIYIVINFFRGTSDKLIFFDSIFQDTLQPNITEILWACLVAICIAIMVAIVINKKWLSNTLRKLKISQQTGSHDVWSNLLAKEIDWIVIRDSEKDLMYQGKVKQYSDKHESPEIYMTDVTVYKNKTGKKCYELAGLYLSFEKSNINIEFQKV